MEIDMETGPMQELAGICMGLNDKHRILERIVR